MRNDDFATFGRYNVEDQREPRFVTTISYTKYDDIALTSHFGLVNAPDGELIEGVISGVSSISQSVYPLQGRSEMGSFKVKTLDRTDDTLPLYDGNGDDYWLSTTNINPQVGGKAVCYFYLNSLTGTQVIMAPGASFLRVYVSGGNLSIWRTKDSAADNTGLSVAASTRHRVALWWDGDGNYSIQFNDKTTVDYTYNTASVAAPMKVGGETASDAVDGFVWNIRLWIASTTTDLFGEMSHYWPATEGTGQTYYDQLGSNHMTQQNVVSPQAGVWTPAVNVGLDLQENLASRRRPQTSPESVGEDVGNRPLKVYVGFTDDFDDFIQITSTRVSDLLFKDGQYTFSCVDTSKYLRKTIFEKKRTRLSVSLTDVATTVTVVDTSEFESLQHTLAFTDAPGDKTASPQYGDVGYFKIVDTGEIIRWKAKSSTVFTVDTDGRGRFDTVAQAQTVSGSDPDDWPEVEEFIYLEGTAPTLAYALATGYWLDSAWPGIRLPDHWNAGLELTQVNNATYSDIGEDLYQSETQGFMLRFTHLSGTDAKKFIEEQINVPAGMYTRVASDGRLEARRVNDKINDAAYDLAVTRDTVVRYGALKNKPKNVINQYRVDWDYNGEKYLRTNLFIDADSISRNNASTIKILKLKGVVVSRFTVGKINTLLKRYLDRFRDPPMTISVTTTPETNVLEASDTVSLNLNTIVRDAYAPSGTSFLDRVFEVQRITTDWVKGTTKLDLLAGSADPSDDVVIGSTPVVTGGFYTSKGSDIAAISPLVVDGSGNVTRDFTLTGYENGSTLAHDTNHADSIYYYDGDLTIPSGRTINIEHSVQLRVKGTLTINGTINGEGKGWPGFVDGTSIGATWPGYPANNNTGYVGHVMSSDGVILTLYSAGPANRAGQRTNGQSVNFPILTLDPGLINASPEATDIIGIPTSLTGARAMFGGPLINGVFTIRDRFRGTMARAGGSGGASGSGLAVVCRGMGFGLNGLINLSGTTGLQGTTEAAFDGSRTYAPGSGAGGGQGSLLVILDGGNAPAPNNIENRFTAKTGATPIQGQSARGMFGNGIISWDPIDASPLPTLTGFNAGDYLGELQEIMDEVERKKVSYRVLYLPETI